ncbi:MAG: hypothetical protein LBR80_16300 [Deltaproteobacteria bacterium]|nr:hypothetical protein [Deltaproteobacteria bacterium]
MARRIVFSQEELERARQWRDNHGNDIREEYRASLVVLYLDKHGSKREDVADLFGIDIKTV